MEIVELLQKHNSNDQLTTIKERLGKLLGRVKTDRNLNAGGQFEWVDSVLIKVNHIYSHRHITLHLRHHLTNLENSARYLILFKFYL